MKNKIGIVFIVLLISCNNTTKMAEIEFTKEMSFNTIKVGDTISRLYTVKNISNNVLKIKQVKTSCGCTIAKLKDSIINPKSSTQIKATFIARKDDIGIIEKSIVIESNTNPNFNVMYLKGKVE